MEGQERGDRRQPPRSGLTTEDAVTRRSQPRLLSESLPATRIVSVTVFGPRMFLINDLRCPSGADLQARGQLKRDPRGRIAAHCISLRSLHLIASHCISLQHLAAVTRGYIFSTKTRQTHARAIRSMGGDEDLMPWLPVWGAGSGVNRTPLARFEAQGVATSFRKKVEYAFPSC